MSTRAITFLKKAGVEFEVIKYDHGEKGAEFAAHATGFPLEHTIKTLVVELDPHQYALALMPGHRQLDLKVLARHFKAKRAAMVEPAKAERLTGYLVGGISPFGTREKFSVVMAASVMDLDQVMINGGQRGTMLIMVPGDIITALKGRTASIERQEHHKG
jgi:Cys-tRNA(Pro)/Cys-tRNA(Cys) deacylase